MPAADCRPEAAPERSRCQRPVARRRSNNGETRLARERERRAQQQQVSQRRNLGLKTRGDEGDAAADDVAASWLVSCTTGCRRLRRSGDDEAHPTCVCVCVCVCAASQRTLPRHTATATTHFRNGRHKTEEREKRKKDARSSRQFSSSAATTLHFSTSVAQLITYTITVREPKLCNQPSSESEARGRRRKSDDEERRCLLLRQVV